MLKHKGIFIVALIIMGALLAGTLTYQVDELNDIVLVKTFSRVTAGPLQGAKDAGLHFKIPLIQTVTVYRAKDYVLEDPDEEVQTSDHKPILVGAFCNWRIEDAAKLYNAIGSDSVEKAEQTIRTWLQATKGAVLGKYEMSAIINTDPSKMMLGRIEKEILDGKRGGSRDETIEGLAPRVVDAYGIRVTNVGLKVVGLPEGATRQVIANQIQERTKEANTYREMGDSQATAIIKRADAARSEIVAFAQRRAESIRTQGQRDAARYYGTFKENEKLAMYLRSLESLKKELAGRALLVLDSSWNPVLGFFHGAPSLDAIKLPQEAKAMINKQPATAPNKN